MTLKPSTETILILSLIKELRRTGILAPTEIEHIVSDFLLLSDSDFGKQPEEKEKTKFDSEKAIIIMALMGLSDLNKLKSMIKEVNPELYEILRRHS